MNALFTWYKTNTLFLKNQEKGLVYLYETLIDNLHDIEYCDKFLKYSMKEPMRSDIIIHIHNALSPIKDKLSYWDKFIEHSTYLLKEQLTEKEALELIKIINL